MFTKVDFNELVRCLRQNGYKVKVHTEIDKYGLRFPRAGKVMGLFASVTGRNIVAKFAYAPRKVYGLYIDNRLCADHAEAFNKPQQCPLIIDLPTDNDQIVRWLELLSRKNAFELSNTFEYNTRIPNIFHKE